MNISQNGIKLIKQFEGCELTAYRDVVGVWTIGYGHTGDVKEGETITQAQADEILANDLKTYVAGVNNLVKVSINQNQFDALVSFAFNLGVSALGMSTLLQDINAHNFQAAAGEFGHWNHAGGQVVAGLTARRAAEAALFEKPVPVVHEPVAVTEPSHYTIKAGDVLSAIAAKFKTTIQHLMHLNGITNPDHIEAGERITVESVAAPVEHKTYVIKEGDNLTAIANEYGTSVEHLVSLNGLKDKNHIEVGQTLKIN